MAELQFDLDVDTVCSLLGDETRRCVLRRLADASEPVTTTELATGIAGHVDGIDSPERMAVRLRHVHLPKLADGNAVRYEVDAGTVAATGTTGQLLACLDAVERELPEQRERRRSTAAPADRR